MQSSSAPIKRVAGSCCLSLTVSSEGAHMTETLAQKKCTPCRGGIPRLTLAEAEHFRSQTPNWELRDDCHRIERTFHLSNFRAALDFVRDVGDLAETEGHHPRCQLRLGLRDHLAAHQEDQGTTRERFYHGEQDRSDLRCAEWSSRSSVRSVNLNGGRYGQASAQ